MSPAWDLVEAYARIGRVDAARELFVGAAEAMPAASPAEEAVIERCAGIVADDSSFEPAFEGALALHDSEPFPLSVRGQSRRMASACGVQGSGNVGASCFTLHSSCSRISARRPGLREHVPSSPPAGSGCGQ